MNDNSTLLDKTEIIRTVETMGELQSWYPHLTPEHLRVLQNLSFPLDIERWIPYAWFTLCPVCGCELRLRVYEGDDIWLECDSDDTIEEIGDRLGLSYQRWKLPRWKPIPGETREDRRAALQRRYGDLLTRFQLDVLSAFHGVWRNLNAPAPYAGWFARCPECHEGKGHHLMIHFDAAQRAIIQIDSEELGECPWVEMIITPATLELLPTNHLV